MLKRLSTIILLFIFTISLSAQIVSIDKRRTKNPNKGFQGDVNLGLNFVHTTTDMMQLMSRFKLQYNDNDNTYLFSSDISFSKVDEERNVNNGGLMFKYNYWVPDKIIIAEAFYQYQYNRVKQLKHRHVMGGGPRFNIADKEKFSLFLVAYTIYLNELFETSDYERRKSLVKFSSMLSTDWQMSPNASLSHSTYYEPDYSDPADFRIWSETKFNVKITKMFSFALYLRFDYDNLVPPEVDQLFYTINNSFSLNF
ncbi:DUF481 domain-containing protein [Carboxylicivirga sediminis]|uniref:DUF481 domain-containing protein n=1 Tax=Carboxylicivirga sediminis TaxID=2006564 RepID=A0A941F4S5_9BACT|nr:DUF481 domain-containing protein [Carboxylicivirga sediminis]MBR8535928.1 DUF481 domain-containing protein [Carboxylicivirga sediminis]